MTKISEPEKEIAPKGRRPSSKMADKSLWEVIDEVMCDVPEETLSRIPADGAERHDHYLNGARDKATQES